jgi:hypothetical protein
VPVLTLRVSISPGEVPLDMLCAGYELLAWRDAALVGDMFDRHLLSFALNYGEYEAVTGATAVRSIREAAISVYSTDKYGRRGEFGEMLLHGALLDFYGSEPAVSKIYYEDSSNEVVKGFDGVHLVATGEEPRVWLGEAKFYGSINQAVDAGLADIRAHLDAGFLRNEFMFISRKIDNSWPWAAKFKEMIAAARSLDDIAGSIVMPIFITYDSAAVSAHDVVSDEYVAAIQAEGELALERFEAGLEKPLEVELRLILVPLQDKKRVIELMHEKLKALREL